MQSFIKNLRHLLDGAAKLCELLTWLILLVWVAVITVGVVLRYVFSAPLLFQTDLVSGLLVVFAALCFAGNLVRDQHIRVDLITRHLPPGLQRWLLALSYLVTALFAAIMVWASKSLIYISFRMQSRFDVSGLPLWPFQAAFIFGFALLFCVSLLRFLELATDRKSPLGCVSVDGGAGH